jgi:hypothetical protein
MSKGTVSVLMTLLFIVTFLTPLIPFSNGIVLYVYYLVLTAVSIVLCARVMAFADVDG